MREVLLRSSVSFLLQLGLYYISSSGKKPKPSKHSTYSKPTPHPQSSARQVIALAPSVESDMFYSVPERGGRRPPRDSKVDAKCS